MQAAVNKHTELPIGCSEVIAGLVKFQLNGKIEFQVLTVVFTQRKFPRHCLVRQLCDDTQAEL